MRVTADTGSLPVLPGGAGVVVLTVRNTGEVIEGITAGVPGLAPGMVVCDPPELPLFPDSEGRLTLTITLPADFPAGRHALVVAASSSVTSRRADVPLVMTVPVRADAALTLRPAVQRTRTRARFTATYANRGNVPLDVTFSGADTDRLLRWSVVPPSASVPPGSSVAVEVGVRARRRLTGNELDRAFDVRADGDGLETAVTGVLRQRPLVPRGAVTSVILAAVVLLWAGAFLFGLTKIYGSDPLTKSAPASFFLTSAQRQGLVALVSVPGAVTKSGVVEPGVGGSLSGTVRALSTGLGTGRVVVSALRDTPTGRSLVSSAATQSDGSYSLVGLFPGRYRLRFTASGFTDVWYPAATSADTATPVVVDPAVSTAKVDVTIVGTPATITGTVDRGETTDTTPVTVTARSLQAAGTVAPSATTVAAADGTYTLTSLPAPDTYEVSFTAPGYQPTFLTDRLDGGAARAEPTVRLSAGDSAITGVVTDGHTPLGGVTVSTSAAGRTVSVATPTVGQVGGFRLSGLPTPGTYVVSFSRATFGTKTVVVDVVPGRAPDPLAVTLVGGTGSVTGRVTASTGEGLGGVTVTVGGVARAVATTTLTSGSVGSFALSGLPSPGDYTLTFRAPGYTSQTVPFTLDTTKPPATVAGVLARSAGTLSGRVTSKADSSGLAGATVSVTDGVTVRTTTTVEGAGGRAGSWLVADLPPGTYTVTVSKDGFDPQTAVLTLAAGGTVVQDIPLPVVAGVR